MGHQGGKTYERSDTPCRASDAAGFTLVVCTKDRTETLPGTIASALDTHDPLRLILVDQNRDDRVRVALGELDDDPRLLHVRTTTVGAGRARNVGLELADTDVVCFTDDDCVLPGDYARQMTEAVMSDARVGIVFARVIDKGDGASDGFTPIHDLCDSRTTRRWDLSARHHRLGIGAAMACRRAALSDIGGFDCHMGPGSTFPSADDREIALRMLLRGWHIAHRADITVTHLGFRRNGREARELCYRDHFALGGMYAKLAKGAGGRGVWHTLVFLATVVWEIGSSSVAQRRPTGLTKLRASFAGLWLGLRTPTDLQLRYAAREREDTSNTVQEEVAA